jgi:hypothetical protein
MSALFKMPDAAQSPAGKPIPDTPDIAPASFSQRLQAASPTMADVDDRRRQSFGRLPGAIDIPAPRQDRIQSARGQAAAISSYVPPPPTQLTTDAGAGDIAAAAQRISQLGVARRFASASRPSGAVVIRDLIRYGRGMKP